MDRNGLTAVESDLKENFPLHAVLSESIDYRSFARTWMAAHSLQSGFTYSAIAHRAGFKSRSFPRDVLTGTKNLTARSLEPFVRGLCMEGEIADTFRLLVAIEVSECRKPNQTPAAIRKRLAALRGRLTVKEEIQIGPSSAATKLFQSPLTPLTFAALGTSSTGATKSEIAARTGIDHVDLQSHLTLLIDHRLIVKEGARYRALPTHVALLDQSSSARSFALFYKYAGQRCLKEAETNLSADDKLFLTSCFSVDRNQMPKLKLELRRLLLSFAENSETATGNRIAILHVGLI